MYTFQHSAPLDTTTYPDPGADRTGIPLSQGGIFTLIAVTAPEYCSPEILGAISKINPELWYQGQLLETILNHFEDQNPDLVIDVGKNIYYTLETQFRAMGIEKPADVILTLPGLWQHVTRGDSGEWRSHLINDHTGHLELEQPYNCMFEQGAMQGALECFDASNVQIDHTTCRRKGDQFCTLHITWE